MTATVPFLFLVIMLIRGVTLHGATEGIVTFIKPDFEKLLSFQVAIRFVYCPRRVTYINSF